MIQGAKPLASSQLMTPAHSRLYTWEVYSATQWSQRHHTPCACGDVSLSPKVAKPTVSSPLRLFFSGTEARDAPLERRLRGGGQGHCLSSKLILEVFEGKDWLERFINDPSLSH